MPAAIDAIVHFIPVIFLVVLVHELGHFIAAKAMGIRVERFSIGFPPKLIGKKYGETEYCISAVPLGGYVKMSGMIDESLDGEKTITGAPYEFQSKSTPAKILVICAGVLMNFVLAFAIYTGVTAIRGVGESRDPIVGELQPDYPAVEAGIQAGDEILTVEGKSVATWNDLVDEIHSRPDMATKLTVRREGEILDFEVTPKLGSIPEDGELVDVGLIGIFPKPFYRPASFVESITTGWAWTKGSMSLVITSVRLLVTGKASLKDLSGPVGIAKMSAQSAKAGFLNLLAFVALISINIGFLNILPIPALDGGHLIMVLWEAVVRRPISNRVKLAIQQVGMVFILLLMALIIFNDFTK